MDDRISRLERQLATLEKRLEEMLQGQRVVTAQEFRLEDEKGALRGEWRVQGGNSEPRLALYGHDGQARVTVTVTLDGQPSLAFVDAQGRRRILLQAGEQGSQVALLDAEGRPRAALEVPLSGAGTIWFKDQKGRLERRI